MEKVDIFLSYVSLISGPGWCHREEDHHGTGHWHLWRANDSRAVQHDRREAWWLSHRARSLDDQSALPVEVFGVTQPYAEGLGDAYLYLFILLVLMQLGRLYLRMTFVLQINYFDECLN